MAWEADGDFFSHGEKNNHGCNTPTNGNKVLKEEVSRWVSLHLYNIT